ncbi:ABC transporter substrate-binding protein (plasmid) [Rossellomorea sp. FS2]|uniref:ABC transporter substrate-binding protein n=1 Tax=Rossellomorea sp. FS2 TaxID=3391447 RepID=UPI003A4D78DE
MKKNWLLLGLSCLLMVSLILSGCSSSSTGSSTEDEKVELTLWTWPDNDKTLAKLMPEFEKQNPNIKVKIQAFANGTYPNKLLSGLVSGKGPDVAMLEIETVGQFKEKNAFVDLSKKPFNAGELEGDYAQFAWDYVKKENGEIFALPKNTGPGAMFYRRDLFEAAGLPTEPAEVHELLKTWDDYIKVGGDLTKQGKQWMIATPNEIYGTIMSQAGVSFFDKDGNPQVEHPDSAEALEYVSKAHKAGIVSPANKEWSDEWNATMQNGTVATYFSGNWFGSLLKNAYATDSAGKWGVTFAPEYKGNKSFNRGGDFLSILKTSKHKEEAWKLVQFISGNKDSLKTMYTENDLYPALVDAQKEDWINQPNAFFKDQVVNEVFGTVSEEMQAPTINAKDPIVNEAMGSAITNVIQDKMTTEEALGEASKQVKAKIGN